MSKALRFAAVTVGACIASGALAYAARDSADAASGLVFAVTVVFGFLAFLAAAED